MRQRRISLVGSIIAALAATALSAASAPSAAAAAAPGEVVTRVLVLNFDPIIESHQSQRLHQVLGWLDPHTLANSYANALPVISHGRARYEITQWRDVDSYAKMTDGFRWTDDTYLSAVASGTPHSGSAMVDYPTMLAENGATDAINANQVDEIWVFGGPYFGYYESAMAGPGSFWINGPSFPQVPAQRAYAIMGFSYQVDMGYMLHDLCHRTESSLAHFYGEGWTETSPAVATNWDRFAAFSFNTNGSAVGVGNCHFPANALGNTAPYAYAYNNLAVVSSAADDWLKYPNLTGARTNVSALSWRTTGTQDQQDFMQWWFSRLPHAGGFNSDGKLNNWWRYVFAFNAPTAGNIDAPSSPDGVLATPLNGTQIKVTWTDSSNNETGFRVSDGITTWPVAANSTSFTLSGLTPGTYKCFYAYATNAAGNSATAPPAPTYWTCTTTITPPAAPTNVVATALNGTQIKVTWTDSSNNETGFRVSDGITTWPVAANSTSFTLSGLTPGTYKCFYAYATNAAGNSATAPPAPTYWTCTTTITPPAAPTNVVATALNGTQIKVTWTDSSNNETGFRVSDGITTWPVAANSTSFTLSGLTPGTYKCFYAYATNAAGNSATAPPAPTYWTCTTTP